MYVELPDKRYYKIGEVSKAFDVNASLIRFWEIEFDIIKPKKNAKGNRLFTKEDIEATIIEEVKAELAAEAIEEAAKIIATGGFGLRGIAIDSKGNAWVAVTTSPGFPSIATMPKVSNIMQEFKEGIEAIRKYSSPKNPTGMLVRINPQGKIAGNFADHAGSGSGALPGSRGSGQAQRHSRVDEFLCARSRGLD